MPKESFREKICELADDLSWETIAREMIAQMSEQEAKDFYDYVNENF
jgi:hypothetical protein